MNHHILGEEELTDHPFADIDSGRIETAWPSGQGDKQCPYQSLVIINQWLIDAPWLAGGFEWL